MRWYRGMCTDTHESDGDLVSIQFGWLFIVRQCLNVLDFLFLYTYLLDFLVYLPFLFLVISQLWARTDFQLFQGPGRI